MTGTQAKVGRVHLEKGKKVAIQVGYARTEPGPVNLELIWSESDRRPSPEAVSSARSADVVIAVLGITSELEGEEMVVSSEGFRGGDRTDIVLPRGQEALLKAVRAVGRPVVLVLLNGSALAVNWADENVPAIVEAWYPGEEGGTALADVLFGDYNPGGRLPVTFYKSVSQLPPFDDYSMQNRTYRYFKGEPLYPFGFGLSYTKFKYDNLKPSSKSINAGENVTIQATVENTGSRAGEEVVQMYVTQLGASVPVPIRSLAGVTRISLKPGEKRAVTFVLNNRQMSVIDNQGRRVVEPGELLITIGGKQPGFTGHADASTTSVIQGRLMVKGKPVPVPER